MAEVDAVRLLISSTVVKPSAMASARIIRITLWPRRK